MDENQSYFFFLTKILQKIAESGGDAQKVYPLLKDNIDKLDDRLAELLRAWAITILAEENLEQAQYFAGAIELFSNLIQQFPLGIRENNIEIAINGYKVALELVPKVFTSELSSQFVAEIQNNLGNAYCERIREERAQNLEEAITYFKSALEVYTRKAFPEEWARSQMNLGTAYIERIRKKRAQNLEEAITCFKSALEVYTRKTFPEQWAMSQVNLAFAYCERIRGKRAQNLEEAITFSKAALEVFTPELFPQQWAKTQVNLGMAYSQRLREERAQNLEEAIACYEAALKMYTYDTFPQYWATIQMNLGMAYKDRIKGERAQNLEKAIAFSKAALKVYTRKAFPFDWAKTQNNLATVYCERIRGERAQNLEEAITCSNKALEVFTYEAFPEQWAMSQMTLANAYSERIQGKRAQNLEQAIIYYKTALKVYTHEAFPQYWGIVQQNLAAAYWERIWGERAQNLEQAITYLNSALKIFTRDAFPQYWATIKMNLAAVYSDRIRGEQGQNIEEAILYYQEALDVFTRKAFPHYWALTQNNLTTAYLDRIRGDREQNLEQAINCSNAALEIFKRQAFPTDWAKTKMNLGIAYGKRIRGDREQNLEQAIDCCEAALKVVTYKTFPQYWANIQHNLGNFYSDRIRGNKAENLEKAICCFQSALKKVRTREAFPQDHVTTKFNLGVTYQDSRQFSQAYSTYKAAIETVESLRGEIVFGSGREQDKQKLAEEWNKLYRRMVEVCLELGYREQALEYLEGSKNRNLVELIVSRDLRSIFSPEDVIKLEKIRDDIASDLYELQNVKIEDPSVLVQNLQRLRQQYKKIQDEYLNVGSGFKLEDFQDTLDENTAVVEFYVTGDQLLTFIFIRQTQQLIVWQSEPKDLEKLVNLANGYFRAYYNHKIGQLYDPKPLKESHWQRRLNTRLHLLAEILHIDDIIQQIPPECDRLILIPHQYLHLLPLHALPINSQKGEVKSEILMHRFPAGVNYAPSCQLLELAQTRKRPDFTRLFAVQDPTDNLDYANLEVEEIKSFFNLAEVEVLASQNASEAAVKVNQNLTTAHCSHFSCHGYFNPESPLESALILAETKTEQIVPNKTIEDGLLTLGEIFGFNLNQCRLVTLSACETGLIDPTNTSDEYIGLPSGFLVAGSPAVVSSLWTVNDLSTALLMIKFYENLQKQMSVALALNQAQLWLRDATKEELQTRTGKLSLDSTWKGKIRRLFNKMEAGGKPFQSPYHWAAFTAVGK